MSCRPSLRSRSRAPHLPKPESKPLADHLYGQEFSTVLGQVSFDEKGDLSENPYRAFRFDGSKFVPLELANP